jgi:hypothetical protein
MARDGNYVLREMQLIVNGRSPMGIVLGGNSKKYLEGAVDGVYTEGENRSLEVKKLWYMECDAKLGSSGNLGVVPRGGYPVQIDWNKFDELGRPGIINSYDGVLTGLDGGLAEAIQVNERFDAAIEADKEVERKMSEGLY